MTPGREGLGIFLIFEFIAVQNRFAVVPGSNNIGQILDSWDDSWEEVVHRCGVRVRLENDLYPQMTQKTADIKTNLR